MLTWSWSVPLPTELTAQDYCVRIDEVELHVPDDRLDRDPPQGPAFAKRFTLFSSLIDLPEAEIP